MTILSKEALEKIRQELAAQDKDETVDINELFKHLDAGHQDEERKQEEYNPLVGGDFDTLHPKK